MNIIEDDQSPILYGGFFPTKSPKMGHPQNVLHCSCQTAKQTEHLHGAV